MKHFQPAYQLEGSMALGGGPLEVVDSFQEFATDRGKMGRILSAFGFFENDHSNADGGVGHNLGVDLALLLGPAIEPVTEQTGI